MNQLELLVTLQARLGKEAEVEGFLKSALPLVEAETGTTFAFKVGPATFGIFDKFKDEAGRTAHVTGEVAKREGVYADFAMSASNLLLKAYTHDEIALGGDEQRLIGLINRMRLFASPEVVSGAEAVLRAIVDISLKPSIQLRQLAADALSKSLDPEPLLAFSLICRADLDKARRMAL